MKYICCAAPIPFNVFLYSFSKMTGREGSFRWDVDYAGSSRAGPKFDQPDVDSNKRHQSSDLDYILCHRSWPRSRSSTSRRDAANRVGTAKVGNAADIGAKTTECRAQPSAGQSRADRIFGQAVDDHHNPGNVLIPPPHPRGTSFIPPQLPPLPPPGGPQIPNNALGRGPLERTLKETRRPKTPMVAPTKNIPSLLGGTRLWRARPGVNEAIIQK